jgi:transposase
MRSKRKQLEQALMGRLRPHRAFLLREHLSHLEYFDEAIERFSSSIAERLCLFEWAIELLDTIPGLSRRSAKILLAEIGTDLSRFPSAQHLAAWAGIVSGQ